MYWYLWWARNYGSCVYIPVLFSLVASCASIIQLLYSVFSWSYFPVICWGTVTDAAIWTCVYLHKFVVCILIAVHLFYSHIDDRLPVYKTFCFSLTVNVLFKPIQYCTFWWLGEMFTPLFSVALCSVQIPQLSTQRCWMYKNVLSGYGWLLRPNYY